jgi:hypothetical protein
MMGVSLKQRIHSMSQPVEHSTEEEIWEIVRSWLIITRIITFITMIALAEFFEDITVGGLSVSLWSLIVGIPVFLILSIIIIWGDRWMKNHLLPENENLLGEVDRTHGRQAQMLTPGIDSGKSEVKLHPIFNR